MEFEILLDCPFKEIIKKTTKSPIESKFVLSIVNGYENGNWRYSNFHNFIWDNIAETSLSQHERNCLYDKPQSILIESAKNLRLSDKNKDDSNDIGKGSELAEIILYGLMKHIYKALPVVPKIFYKQNIQDNAKGADSVHIVLEGDDDFSLWFGEAKFYNSIENSRLGEIITSVGNSLNTDKLKKENSIITNIADIDLMNISSDLIRKIKSTLSYKTSIDEIKPKIHIPILLLHECTITSSNNKLTDTYKNEITEYHKERATAYFEKQIKQLGSIFDYASIKFHVILFPVPSKEKIINKFVKRVEIYKEEAKDQ
jgi:hypothetical protein